ncbi:Sodium/hydrogen exchanger family-domain-containing protein [Mycena sp. CBHHK59/15]|nr:Sodium/hydrogen exchanger family-domain-containing protein [Mycena sp. CBHHK59/15]
MPEFSNTIISLFHKRATAEQGGLLSGKDPSAVNLADPLRLWIIQVGVIVGTASLLSLGLRKIHQPKVIAEVLGGILLGPTAFGRIPGFSQHIFPEESQSYLSLVANIGLVLFLFLVGLEIEGSIIKRNARLSATVALAGMILPFGLGAGLAVPLYHEFIPRASTFPVLCRILTELKLLDTTVGIVVLSAGVGNDIIGWTLLALSVALVNAGSGLTALWILMVCVGWTLFLLFPVKLALRWLAHKTGSIENGPTTFFMTVTFLLVFGSAFFTDVIGVHAIFGAFVAGLIVPREGGLAIALTEKLEDMVSIIFLPLYFTLSGLSTDLGLLNNGITWAYTVAICSLAFIGKFGGCTIAARYFAGFSWRESSTIGSLMSCKGLVELIVLNVGLSANILSQRVFSMFVLEALLLTFMTTPLVTLLYPLDKRVRVSATGANFNNVDGGDEAMRNQRALRDVSHTPHSATDARVLHHRGGLGSESTVSLAPSESLSIEALRLIELSDRVSAVMKSSASESLLLTDPLLSIFRMFGQLHDLRISTALSIVTLDDLAHSVAEHARKNNSDMIMLPWLPTAPTHPSAAPTIAAHEHEAPTPGTARNAGHSHNPFDALFKSSGAHEKSASAPHAHFVRGVFSAASTDVALFVDQANLASGTSYGDGAADDEAGARHVGRVCGKRGACSGKRRLAAEEANTLTAMSAVTGFPDTVYGHATLETRMQSETADNVAWAKYASQSPRAGDRASKSSAASNPGIEFRELASSIPLHAAIREVNQYNETRAGRGRPPRVLVVVGRSRRMAVENHATELKELTEQYGSVGTEGPCHHHCLLINAMISPNDDEAPEDILSSSLLSLYEYHPITLSSAGSLFVYNPPGRSSQIILHTPDTEPANWPLHASSVWAASRFLADHIDYLDIRAHLSRCPPGKRVKVLELGAAAGLPSIVLAKRYPEISVTVSDYPDTELIRTLTQNVNENGASTNCRVVPYGWGSDISELLPPNDNDKFDLLIAADTLWNPEFHAHFITTLQITLRQSPDARIHLFAGLHTGRYTIQSFLNASSAAGFDLETALEKETNGERQRSWNVDRAEGEEESERRRWIVCLCLKWKLGEY